MLARTALCADAAADALLPYWAEEPVAEPGRARVQGRFDLIMGSDILYERDEGGALAGYIARHA